MLKIEGQKHKPLVPRITMFCLLVLSCIFHWKDIVVDEGALRFTRRDLLRDVKTLAKALLKMGVKKGDIVTVYSGRSMYANVVNFFAVNRLKAIVCFHDERVEKGTLIGYLNEFKSPILIAYRQTEGWMRRVLASAPSVQYAINMTSPHNKRTYSRSILETYDFMWSGVSVAKYAETCKEHLPLGFFGANVETLISFTSGSTSGPKPIVFTNKNLIAQAIFSKVASGVKMWDKVLHSWMSFVHLDCPYGLMVSVIAPICGGGKVVMTPDFCEDNMDYYFSKNPNVIFGIPTLLELMVDALGPEVDLSHLKMFACGGDRLDPGLAKEAIALFEQHGAVDVKMANGYGTGESGGLISTSVGDVREDTETVGKIPPGVSVMLLKPKDENDRSESEGIREVGFNEQGELLVTGDHIAVRYFNRPELTAQKFLIIDGVRFLRTGDLATVEPDGTVRLLGRDEFFIIQTDEGPAKVYCAVVGTAVLNSDLVKDCRVVKGPGEGWNFEKNRGKLVPYAFVETYSDVPQTDETCQRILEDAKRPYVIGNHEDSLKSYEVPWRIILKYSLPHTDPGKVDFRKLEREAIEIARECATS